MERIIVDGYNIVHAWPPLKRLLAETSLETARDKLIDRLAVLSHVTGAEVTVVFDAHHSAARSNSEELVDGVRVVFSRKGHSADHVIERMAYEAGEARDVLTVATSDRSQRDLVRGMGGAVITAIELERQVKAAEEEMSRRVKKYS